VGPKGDPGRPRMLKPTSAIMVGELDNETTLLQDGDELSEGCVTDE
jgi:dihydroxyacid dehydratase/phosphogluconate dehydratase